MSEIPLHQGRSMEVDMRTNADPLQVWNAWADPEKISQWFADRAEGWAHKGAEVTWMFDEFGYRIPYHVVESIPGERLVFGGQIPGRPPFLLDITIRREAGDTVVRLVNSGFLEGGSFDEEYEGVLSGWTLALAMLKYYVEEHYGEPKQTILVTREADVDFNKLIAWYTEPELMNQWLTSSADARLRDGEPYHFVLRNGTPVNGIVAKMSKRELANIWPEQSAFVELKGWTAGPKKVIAIRITCWNPDDGFMEHARSETIAALNRLAAAMGT
jgi:uncharacterized protein YndB with AHSA1/START domain